MKNEVVVIQNELQEVIKSSNISDLTKAEKIAISYVPLFERVTEQSNILKTLKKENIEDAEKAKKVFTELGRIAADAERQKKIDKDDILIQGRYIDGLFNTVNGAARLTQNEAKEIRDFAENKERERIEALKQARVTELEPFSEFVPFGIDLGTLSESDYNNVLNGAKLQLQAKKDAELKAEQERIEAERLAEIERQKEIERQQTIQSNKEQLLPLSQWIINFDLIDFETVDLRATIESAKKVKADHDAKVEAQRIENERLKAERDKAQKEAEQLEAKRQAELKAEREKHAKIQAELDAEKERQAKAERERLAKLEAEKLEAEKLAKAPIKKQMEAWINLFEIPTTELNNDVVKEIQQKFDAFKDWSKKQISKI
jgi:colicin import membrane protein